MTRYSEHRKRVALLKLAENDGYLAPTARSLHLAPKTLRKWRDDAARTETPPAVEPDGYSYPDPPEPHQFPTTQIQEALIASAESPIPSKQAKVSLYSEIVDRYGLKVLDLLDTQMSAVQAATVLGIATQRMQELAEGRHKQQAQVVEQHLHTGPEYHRAAASNAAKHPKHRRKQQ